MYVNLLDENVDEQFDCSIFFYHKEVYDENPCIYIFSQLSNNFLEQSSRNGISTWKDLLILNFKKHCQTALQKFDLIYTRSNSYRELPLDSGTINIE